MSAGFIAFRGLAASMAANEEISGCVIYGNYQYNDGEFEQGGAWKWTSNENGATGKHCNLSARIDEDITLNLEPYGIIKSFTLPISCSGEVKLEYTYEAPPYLIEKPLGKPQTAIRFIPEAVLKASKDVTDSWLFKVNGHPGSPVKKNFFYPATLELAFKAEPAKS